MRSLLPLAFSALLVAACATNDVRGAGESCGPNTPCAVGYECDPGQSICVKAGTTPDATAAATPDASEPSPDAIVVPPDAALPDAAPPDAALPDAALPDAAPPDATLPDAPPPDAALPDANTIPVVTINSPAPGAVTGVRTTLAYTAIPAAVAFTCAVDNSTAASCGSGSMGSYDLGALDLASGNHTAVVRTLDAAGHMIGAGASVTWTVERSGPIFTIDSVTAKPDSGMVNATYHSSVVTGQRACTLDGHPCETCSATAASCGLASAGAHVFTVSGSDMLGNPGPPTASDPVTLVYTPNQGRAYLMGMDYDMSNKAADLALHRAFEQVPFRLKKTFDRKLRVAAYRQDTVAQSSVVHAFGAITDLVDLPSYREFNIPGELGDKLAGSDVLLVYDQQDPTNLDALGIVWEPSLRAFLDAGGVVVVLDGLGPAQSTEPSGTYQVVAEASSAGQAPIIAVTSAAAFSTSNAMSVDALPDDVTVVTGEAGSPLESGGGFDPPRTCLVYGLADDTEEARPVLGAIVTTPNDLAPRYAPTVIEKIFPTYAIVPGMPATVGPAAPFSVDVTPPTPRSSVECAVRNLTCNRTGSAPKCLCNGSSSNVCACDGDADAGFTVPFVTSGSYVATVRLTDPSGRPGRTGTLAFTIDLPKVTVTPSSLPFGTNYATFCFRAATVDNRPLTYNLTFDGQTVQRDAQKSSQCADTDVGSLTFYRCQNATHTFITNASDSSGNTGQASVTWHDLCFF
jgi:hypothetical protein